MRLTSRLFAPLCALALSALPAFAQNGAITPALVEKTAQANFAEFFDMLALPNDAINAEDIRKNADWLEKVSDEQYRAGSKAG